MEAIKVCVSQNKINASLKIETASDSCIVGYLSEAVFYDMMLGAKDFLPLVSSIL